jgi:hypothetical protein
LISFGDCNSNCVDAVDDGATGVGAGCDTNGANSDERNDDDDGDGGGGVSDVPDDNEFCIIRSILDFSGDVFIDKFGSVTCGRFAVSLICISFCFLFKSLLKFVWFGYLDEAILYKFFIILSISYIIIIKISNKKTI